MARDATDPSPPESLGGDDARDLYDELTDHLLYHPAIGRATIMGYPCMRLPEGSWRPTTTRPGASS
jgi:hypothetical protein